MTKVQKIKGIKIHTSNKQSVETILSNIKFQDEMGEYGIKYKLNENYFKFSELNNEHYSNLPEFKWSDKLKNRFLYEVQFRNQNEKDVFFNAFNQKQTKKTYIYHELDSFDKYEYVYTENIQPKYPIYVITKGRWEKSYTIDTLEDMGVDFYICVEPSEYEKYCSNPKVDKNKIIILPENFSEQGNGAVPVRNFVWEHSVQQGHPKHWQLDDNILWFYRWNNNQQLKVRDGVFFRIMEDFSDRYENIGLTSCQYKSFIPGIDTGREEFIVNTRAYSCILINTELLDTRLDERWRGRYNDDTDLSLRVLSTGDICTVNFNSLLSGKQTSGSMKGGMAEIYDNHSHNGYMKKFNALKDNWGDIVKLTNKRHKDGRPHHIIEYTKLFNQTLVLKEGVDLNPKINNYNMVLVESKK
jgi:hypothetical protein